MRFLALLLCAACGGGSSSADAGVDAAPVRLDRAHLANVGTTGRLDYGDQALWLCKAGSPLDECAANLDSTEILPDAGMVTVAHTRADAPAFDCFYVYPTISLNRDGNLTDFSDISIELDPLLSQAARFTRICKVYAPLYRQQSGAATGGFSGDPAVALQDVRDALAYYLAHLNGGRDFVILGHSQGSFVLARVLQLDVEGHPDVMAKMISAVLLGGEIKVAREGQGALPECATFNQGNCVSFHDLPLCKAPGDKHCVVAYSSFRAESPPKADTAIFGRDDATTKTACTEPAALASSAGPYRGSYLPTHYVNPLFTPSNAPIPAGVTTPFVLERGRLKGQCVDRTSGDTTFTYLEVSLAPGDPRPAPPYYSSAQEAFGYGLHIADYNLALDDLIDAVAKQAAK
jgi:DUF3089 family protein